MRAYYSSLHDTLHAIQVLVQLEQLLMHPAEAQTKSIVAHEVDVCHEVVVCLDHWCHLLAVRWDEPSVGEICR